MTEFQLGREDYFFRGTSWSSPQLEFQAYFLRIQSVMISCFQIFLTKFKFYLLFQKKSQNLPFSCTFWPSSLIFYFRNSLVGFPGITASFSFSFSFYFGSLSSFYSLLICLDIDNFYGSNICRDLARFSYLRMSKTSGTQLYTGFQGARQCGVTVSNTCNCLLLASSIYPQSHPLSMQSSTTPASSRSSSIPWSSPAVSSLGLTHCLAPPRFLLLSQSRPAQKHTMAMNRMSFRWTVILGSIRQVAISTNDIEMRRLLGLLFIIGQFDQEYNQDFSGEHRLIYISFNCRISDINMDKDTKKPDMEYRNLGPTGIKVSVISFGNWVNSNTQQAKQLTIDCVKKAWDLGINFFDTAELYGYGEAEVQFGEALKQLNVPRHHLVVSTKLFWGTRNNIPNTTGLSRKHIIQGTKASLKRLGLDYVDVMFCHRPDYDTPVEETCRAFDWAIRKGLILYWGTSQWNAEDIAEAHMVCEKYGLIKPVVEQPEYNLFIRNKVQFTYRHLFDSNKLGSTVWSPLASGVLTGKYNNGIPEGSRFDKNPQLKVFMAKYLNQKTKDKTLKALNDFQALAKELGCSMAQLAMAWVINNPDVSTAITGATKVEQLEDTVKAVAVRRKFTKQIERRIENIFQTAPKGKLDMPKGLVHKSRRFALLGYAPSQISDGVTESK